MFQISSDAKRMDCASGEPIHFDIQLASGNGEVESLAGATIAFGIYDAARTLHVYQELVNGTDASGDFARLILDGKTSEYLLNATGLIWDVSYLLDNGVERLLTGTLTIEPSAPGMRDNNGAPVIRRIVRIKRLADFTSMSPPQYQLSVIPYVASTTPAPPPIMTGLDFGSPVNSGYVAMF